MPKKISAEEKEKITLGFLNGEAIQDLSEKFNFTKITISRLLKKSIGEQKYKDLTKINNSQKKKIDSNFYKTSLNSDENKEILNTELSNSFFEIEPLDCEIDNFPQKDLSSIPISEIDFPNNVYMVVDKKIELEIKYLRDYPQWQFLSNEELNRKTIEIHYDLKVAKRYCNKEQKVIKIPNTNVFKIASNVLLNKGISRIVSSDKLISL